LRARCFRESGENPELLWVNPDCGLKTRDWEETRACLRNIVEAANRIRETIPATG